MAAPTLNKIYAEISGHYKVCSKKLGLKYKNYHKLPWSTKTKIRRCVADRRRRKK